ncbi:MAG: hypothetical protein GXP62_14695 [Oligoflexia bacterium]|nr:hypothetical protein [Oligoflexia bacterium]
MDLAPVWSRPTRDWQTDPVPGSSDDQISLQAAVHQLEQTDLPWTLTLGHHPCRSNGAHGSVGGYRDFGLHLHSGDAFQALFQQEIMDVDLYASGHDHSTQFLAEGPPSLVVGAGAKPQAPSTPNSSMDFEAYCMLGFAILDATPGDLALEIHTLMPPGLAPAQAPCLSKMARRRPDIAVPQPACARFLRGADRVWTADPAGCSVTEPVAN